ncbi:hypothetical protein LSAT2_016128 [Lamellibrachia satsuma]|nr:hypothetical protein LSAT2_016128 [Lamellibrachia satsuma]
MKKSIGEEDTIEVATGVIDGIEDSYTMKRRAVAKVIVQKTMNVLTIVSKVVLAGLVAGEKAEVLKFDDFALGLQKDTAYHLSNALIALPTSGYNGIKLPTLYCSSLNISASDYVNINVFQSSNNLYNWGASSRSVSTGNVGLTITNDKYNRIDTKDLITINIPIKPANIRAYIEVNVDVKKGEFGRRDIRHFTTIVETNKMFHMTFTQLDAESTATLLLVLKKDTYSRVNDFFGEPDSGPPAALYLLDFGNERRTSLFSTMSFLGFNSSVTETNNNTVVVSGIVTHGPPTSRLFLGLLPAFYESEQCQKCEKESTSCGFCHEMFKSKSILKSPQRIVRLAVSTRMQDCLYWNPQREVWTNTACKVFLGAKPGYIVCECKHLSAFAGNLLVAPNKVDLFNLKMFLNVFQNPIVVSLLIAFWCTFSLMTVWARRKDGKDSDKANMVVLMDNEDKSDYYYLVTVLTGWVNGGGTTSAVAFYIAGNWACTKTHVIYDPDTYLLEAGSEKWFLLAAKQSLGDLRRLTIWHSSNGLFPSWYLNQITVRDVQTNECWHFVCNDWLTPARGIRSIRRSLAIYNSIKFSYRFKLKATQSFRDQHLWLSIFLRPAHSFFTRVQRVACAMSFIMVSMVINIMWYGHAESDDDIDIVDHSITITREEIIIGLQSLILTTAINMGIVCLFRGVPPRPLFTGSNTLPYRTRSKYVVEDTHAGYEESQDHHVRPICKNLKHRHVWRYYVAWFLAVSTSVVATFVTAQYSLTYGYSASVKWTISFFSTFVENIGIVQPMRVSLLAVVFSYFFGSKAGPASPANYYVELAKDKECVSAMERKNHFRRLPPKHMYRLPDPAVLGRATRRLVKEQKLWRTLHDAAIGVFLLALVFTIAYGSTNHWSFYINKSIQESFVKARYSEDVGLTEVQTPSDIWRYMKYTLLPSFHHNGTTYMSDETNILIGSAIIRQIRVDPKSQRCKASPNSPCQNSYDSHAEDQTSYKRTWKKPIRQDSVTNPYSAWTYQSADTLQMGPITCRHRTYPGGGYVVAIRANMKRMMRLLQDLEDAHWLNNNTRAVLVQFTTFNPTTSLFTISLLAFEFMNVGVVEPYHDINTGGKGAGGWCQWFWGGTEDDKVREDDERDAREGSPQPGRRLRGGKVTSRRETGRRETVPKETRRKEMGGKTNGTKERGVGETVASRGE